MPIDSIQLYGTTSSRQALRELLTPLRGVVNTQDVKSTNVTERPNSSHFHQNRPGGVSPHRHAGFEQHIRACLPGRFDLVLRIALASELLPEARFIIRQTPDVLLVVVDSRSLQQRRYRFPIQENW